MKKSEIFVIAYSFPGQDKEYISLNQDNGVKNPENAEQHFSLESAKDNLQFVKDTYPGPGIIDAWIEDMDGNIL